MVVLDFFWPFIMMDTLDMLAGMVGTSAMVTFDPLHNCPTLARQYCTAPRMDAGIRLAGDEIDRIVDLWVTRTS